MDEQEITRLFLLSPEISQEKIKESIILRLQKEGDREKFQALLDSDPKRAFIVERVKEIKALELKQIKIPDELLAQINMHFLEDRSYLLPRHMRDITKVTAIMKGNALLNFMHREQTVDSSNPEVIETISINETDMQVGFALYQAVSKANELGLPPRDLEEYETLKEEFLPPGVTNPEFQRAYYQSFHKLLGRDKAKNKLELLVNAGLLEESPDPNDRRKVRYMRGGVGYEKTDEQTELTTNNDGVGQE